MPPKKRAALKIRMQPKKFILPKKPISSTKRTAPINRIPPIATGGYGCVYKPPIRCQSPSGCDDPAINERCRTGVSKLLSRETGFAEYKEHAKIASKLGTKYNLGIPIICEPNEESLFMEYESCKSSQYNPKDKILLVFDDAGDIINNKLFEQHLSTTKFINGLTNIFEGITYMVNHGFVHADIKGNNIMVDKNYNFKFIDFGISWDVMPTDQFNSLWQPPEVYLLGPYETFIKDKQMYQYPTGATYTFDSWMPVMKKMLQKRDPRIPDALREKYLKMDMYELYDLIKSKIDVYSLGVMLNTFIVSSNKKLVHFFGSPEIRLLIEHMTDENVLTRATAKNAYRAYIMIMEDMEVISPKVVLPTALTKVSGRTLKKKTKSKGKLIPTSSKGTSSPKKKISKGKGKMVPSGPLPSKSGSAGPANQPSSSKTSPKKSSFWFW